MPTKITLLPAEAAPNVEPTFEGYIATPKRFVVVSTALLDIVLCAPVASDKTRLRVFANDVSFPDDILIVFE